MKKFFFLLLSLILLNSSVFSQITEYIDVTTKEVFGRSEMVLYCEDLNFDDLQYFYIGANNDNYHWVKYTGAKNVIVIMNDSENDTRELCYKNLSEQNATCEIVDAFACTYKLQAKEEIFDVWISKINVKNN